jgi:cholesterol transport system auxiliary component
MKQRTTHTRGYLRGGRGWPVLLLVLPFVLALGGCGIGRSAAPAQLFDLGPPSSAASASGTASTSSSGASSSGALASSASSASVAQPRRDPVAISFSASQMLTDTGVIWRVGDSASPHSYATYRWAASPLQLVQQRVVDTLSAAGPVVLDGVDPRAPLLQVSLTRFEQVYAPDGKSSVGQVSMQAVLVRERRVVDSVLLSRSAPAPTQDAQGGVLALRAATDAAAAELAAWLARRLSVSTANPPAGLTLRSPN